jgi:predicted nucleotidyltransferase component of viral defense system
MNAVDDLQKKVLIELMSIDVLKEHYLAGGTNLALRENHRKSIDLDLFVKKDFELSYSNYINIKMKSFFGGRYTNNSVTNTGVYGVVDGVKVDLVNFPYDLLKPIQLIDGSRLASKIDIAAMKINAVVGRGSKKDFYDIAKLLESFSLKEILTSYQAMFKIDNLLMAEKSLTYFNDADNALLINNKVVSLENKSWDQTKKKIVLSLKNYKNKTKSRDKGMSM